MSVHEQFADDLALLALGDLHGDERAALEKHLDTCADCRRELELLRGDMALLALSAEGPRPPQRSRKRLMEAVRQEPRKVAVQHRRTSWMPVPWLAAAALAIVVGFLWIQNQALKRDLATVRQDFASQQADLRRAREIVATITMPEAKVVTVSEMNKPPQPQGKAFYMRDRGSLIFMASNIPMPPIEKMYELWLIPMSGAPIPAGMFKPNLKGGAMVIHPPLPMGVEAKAFAVTVEPEQGSSTPTMPIMMMGEGE